MKKLLGILLALLVLTCPAMAEETDWYLETAKELTEMLGVLVKDEAYIAMYSSATYECMKPLKQADFTSVKAIYRCALSDEAGVQMLLDMLADGVSDAAREKISAGLLNYILNTYHGSLGAAVLAASSILTCSQTYVAPEGFEPCIYVLKLDGAAVAVVFSRTGDDTLTATACPLFSREGETVEDTLEFFTSDGFPMTIEQIL